MNPPTARDTTADLLKGTAVLLMVQVHIMELFARQEIMDGDAGKVSLFLGGPPVAPVFLALLGFYAMRPERSLGRLIMRGFRLLAVGALLNLGLNLHLFARFHFDQIELNPWEYLFGVDILLLAGLSLIALALLRPLLKDRPLLWAMASMLVAGVAPWITGLVATESDWKWLAAFVAAPVRWSYFPLFPWLAYPLLGVAVFHSRERLRLSRSGIAIALAIGLPALFVTGRFAVATSHDLPAYYHHGLTLFLWNSLFLASWALLYRLITLPQPISSWLTWFGRNVTACYVAQWLLIGNIATAIYRTESLLHCALWFVTLVVATRLLVVATLDVRRKR
jgi:uncharacterized membrane protein